MLNSFIFTKFRILFRLRFRNENISFSNENPRKMCSVYILLYIYKRHSRLGDKYKKTAALVHLLKGQCNEIFTSCKLPEVMTEKCSDFAVFWIPRSQTHWCQWHCKAWLCGIKDTAVFFQHLMRKYFNIWILNNWTGWVRN